MKKRVIVKPSGEKSFGSELIQWRGEAGWKHRTRSLFARAEHLNVMPTEGFDEIDYYVGAKFFFSQEAF
ncbi:MAG: hypothetical protein Q8P84_02760 [Deltaproteobacteria bacterium]|nr:hypothetical protein [Deltaproteobacteria bacterium]